eukprot:Protomagalhaensia_wolfi_Nauph_80__2563@NODE_2719_length_1007_cov_302_996901_g1762_i1_p1_GENE_NODE_2719_length_1007_cov_302_996901_g1762_i1NODE_2719_length_1007_cov_302_996901_g1762_i1_p1_ORF_typecomplete_len226_score29_30Exo_endo_phos/PF03372_23/0_01DUF3275/PF11679_8/0_19LYRIC/PF15686_5/1_2_NODE_2719_length_1007_cov_302_996901_g1762_i1306983
MEQPSESLREVRAELHKKWLKKKAEEEEQRNGKRSRDPSDSEQSTKRLRRNEREQEGAEILDQNINQETERKPVELFHVLSWNVDGLSEKTAFVRTLSIIDRIRELKPACILLQEVIPLTEALIRRYLACPYYILPQPQSSNWKPVTEADESIASRMPYYCMILLSKFHFQKPVKSVADCYYYPGTRMGRAIISVKTKLIDAEAPVRIATTHLESTADKLWYEFC